MDEYTLVIRECPVDDGGGFRATFIELPGCVGDGATREEALKNAEEAKACWISAAKAYDIDMASDRYSGRLLLRMSKEMHRDISLLARSRDVSINSLVTDMMSNALRKASVEFRKAG